MNPGTQKGKGTSPRAGLPELRSAAPRQAVILVVDDNAAFRRLVSALMQGDGHAVLSAAGGHEALQLSREYSGSIDLVIADVEMPRLKGPELCARLIEERPGIQALLISGSDMSKSAIWNVNLAFLPKPFDGEALKTRVRAILAALVEPPLYQISPVR